jgi:hypothetical protein
LYISTFHAKSGIWKNYIKAIYICRAITYTTLLKILIF